MSQSGDETDTPSLQSAVRSSRTSKKPTLQTVMQSPVAPEPTKKLSFTPALTETTKKTPTIKGSKEGSVSFSAGPATPSADKLTARATSSKRSKRPADDDSDEEAAETAPETPAGAKSARMSAKKATKESTKKLAMAKAKEVAEAAAEAAADVAEAPAHSAKEARKSAKKVAKAATPAPAPSPAAIKPATLKPATLKPATSKAATPKAATPMAKASTPAGTPGKDECPPSSRKGRKRRFKARKLREAAALALLDAATGEAANPAASAGGQAADKGSWRLAVHRCRFAGWMPDPIHALAALPAAKPAPGQPTVGGHLLAVARAGGDLELVNVDERWAIAARCAGPRGVHSAAAPEVRALCWVGGKGLRGCGPARVVGGTLGGVLFEADFSRGTRVREVDALGGAVWGLATSTVATATGGHDDSDDSDDSDNSDDEANAAAAGVGGGDGEKAVVAAEVEQLVGAGCEDGTVRVFRVTEGGLEYVKSLGPVGARVTCLAWAQPAADGAQHGALFAGTVDGTIHKFDVGTGRADSRMTLERRGNMSGSGAGLQGEAAAGSGVVVWSLLALSNGSVVSGDSSGSVQFWDGSSCSHGSRLCTHGGDVLCLAATSDERTVFASGTDHKVVALRRLRVRSDARDEDGEGGDALGSGGEGAVWSVAHAYRSHQLDVRALAVVFMGKQQHQAPPEGSGKLGGAAAAAAAAAAACGQGGFVRKTNREILVSGGLDTKLCTYHAGRFEEHRPKRIWPFPYHTVVSVAAASRLLLAMHADRLELWQIPPTVAAAQPADGDGDSGHVLLLQLKLKLASSLVCSALSPDGRFLAASDSDGLRLFRLTHGSEGREATVTVAKVALPGAAMAPCQRLCFEGSRRLLGATVAGTVHVLSLPLASSARGDAAALEHAFPFASDVRGLARADKGAGEAAGTGEGADDEEDEGCGPFSALAVSPDGQYCAVASCTVPTVAHSAGTNSIVVYSLDSMGLLWAPPRPRQRVTDLAFHPPAVGGTGAMGGVIGGRRDAGLLCATAVDNRFHLFDVEARKLADWLDAARTAHSSKAQDCGAVSKTLSKRTFHIHTHTHTHATAMVKWTKKQEAPCSWPGRGSPSHGPRPDPQRAPPKGRLVHARSESARGSPGLSPRGLMQSGGGRAMPPYCRTPPRLGGTMVASQLSSLISRSVSCSAPSLVASGQWTTAPPSRLSSCTAPTLSWAHASRPPTPRPTVARVASCCCGATASCASWTWACPCRLTRASTRRATSQPGTTSPAAAASGPTPRGASALLTATTP